MSASAPLPVAEPASPSAPLVARVRLRITRRMAWLQTIGALYDGVERLQALLDDRDAPVDERRWQTTDPAAREWLAAIAEADEAFANGNRRFHELAAAFALDDAQRCAVETALALELDGDVAELFALLVRHGGHRSPLDIVARLFGYGRTLELAPDAPLLAWGLIVPNHDGRGAPMETDPFIGSWLRGRDGLDPALARRGSICTAHAPLDTALCAHALAAIEELRARTSGRSVRVWIRGTRGSGRRTLAAWIAAQLCMQLVAVDLPAAVDDARLVERTAQRYGLLTGSALAFCGKQPPPAAPLHGNLLEFVIAAPGVRDCAAGEPVIEAGTLSVAQRRRAWCTLLPAADSWPDTALDALARDYGAAIGDVAAVARAAPRSGEEALALLRTRRQGTFDRLAQRLETPFGWDDLVVEPAVREALEELAYEARARRTFWERPEARRLFPQGRGLLAMLTGQPGTGKTMAAQVLARELGVALVRVDLSTVVSKYIGETSQNVDRILRRAARADVVLFFDEADALFAKRTELRDAHDRYANTDTNFLLQAIEAYDGVALLATNQKGHIDPAFVRRVRFAIEFPRPGAGLRLQIWRRIVAALAGAECEERLGPALERFANELEASGAQIKFAVLAAVMLAARASEEMGARHLLRGLERELRKEGRLLGERERRGLLDGVA